MHVCVRNADLVGMTDDGQMHGNAGGAVVAYPASAETAVPGRVSQGPVEGGARSVDDGDNLPMPVRVTKPRRQKDLSADADVSMSSTEDLTAPAAPITDQQQQQENGARKKRRRAKPTTAERDESEALMTAGASDVPAGDARLLKVHIKAQSGASVRIQNAPPPVAPKPAFRSKPHDTSTETDI